MSIKEKLCPPWCTTESSPPWRKPPGGRTADTQSKRGSLKKPSTTFKGQESQHSGSTRNNHSKKPHLGTKKIGEKLTSTCHAKTAYDAPPSGLKRMDGGRVAGYTEDDSPGDLPLITDLYAPKVYYNDDDEDPAGALPAWFIAALGGSGTTYTTLRHEF